VANLKKNVEKLLDANDGKCKRYIEQLLNKASELSPNGEDGNAIVVGTGLKDRSGLVRIGRTISLRPHRFIQTITLHTRANT